MTATVSTVIARAGDFDVQARWRATRAKILARRGQHTTAKQLADEAETLAAPTSWTAVLAQVLEAKPRRCGSAA